MISFHIELAVVTTWIAIMAHHFCAHRGPQRVHGPILHIEDALILLFMVIGLLAVIHELYPFSWVVIRQGGIHAVIIRILYYVIGHRSYVQCVITYVLTYLFMYFVVDFTSMNIMYWWSLFGVFLLSLAFFVEITLITVVITLGAWLYHFQSYHLQ